MLSAPLSVQVEITGQCPNNCIHCYNYWRRDDGANKAEGVGRLAAGQAARIMDAVEAAEVFQVVITGGEPLLNKEAMYRILDRVEASRLMTASINTTLIGLTEKDAERLSHYKRLRGVLTSIMGPNAAIHDDIAAKKGAFDLTVRGTALLNAFDISVSVNMVVSKLNQSYIKAVAHLAKNLGARSFNATRATCPTDCADFTEYSLDLGELRGYLRSLRAAKDEEEIPTGVLTVYPLCAIEDPDTYEMAAGKRCSAGVTAVAISAAGEVRACTHIGISYGNILSEPFSSIWERMSEWRDSSLLPSACKSCEALAICGGGCRVEAKVVYGSFSAPDPLMIPRDAARALNSYHKLIARKSQVVIAIPTTAKFNPEIRFRKEEFGVIAYAGNQCAGFLNENLGSVLSKWFSGGVSVNLNDLADSIPQDIMAELVRRRILVSGECLEGGDK